MWSFLSVEFSFCFTEDKENSYIIPPVVIEQEERGSCLLRFVILSPFIGLDKSYWVPTDC